MRKDPSINLIKKDQMSASEQIQSKRRKNYLQKKKKVRLPFSNMQNLFFFVKFKCYKSKTATLYTLMYLKFPQKNIRSSGK